MLRKELALIKIGIVVFQLLLILLYAPLTGGFLYQLFDGVLLDNFSLFVLFFLNAYGFIKGMQNQLPKVGHLASFIAIALQISIPLYIIATVILIVEIYLLLTNQIPFQLKSWIYRDKK